MLKRTVLCLLLIAVPLPSFGSVSDRAKPEVRNGITEFYDGGHYEIDYAGSIVTSLPAKPQNRSWFCNWIMLVATVPGSSEQPFVQVGEIRWLHANDYPSAFITYAERGGKLTYVDLGRIAEGEHTATIKGDRNTMSLYLDGRRLRTFSRRRFFAAHDRAYLQFASEVKVPGDEPSGYLRDIRVKRDEWPTLRKIDPPCMHYDRGLDMRVIGDRYVPFGRFDPTKPSGFRNCMSF